MTLTAPETITDLDTAWEIPCGGQLHTAGRYGHQPEQFATYEMHNSCCGFRLLLCQGRAEYLKANALVIGCDRCRRDSPIDKWRFDLISRTEGTR